MTDKVMTIAVCSILTTCKDSDINPSSSILLALQTKLPISLDGYNLILGVLQKQGLIEVKNHSVTLTEKGYAKAVEIEKIVS